MKNRFLVMPVLIAVLLGTTAAFFSPDKKDQGRKTAPSSSQSSLPKQQVVPAVNVPASFGDRMNLLSQNMLLWKNLTLPQKTEAIQAVIVLYKNRENTAITNSADFYAKKVDETLQTNPDVLNLDLVTVMKILSVMEYDFYNGQNKEELAKQVLGEKMYAANRLRKGLGQ